MAAPFEGSSPASLPVVLAPDVSQIWASCQYMLKMNSGYRSRPSLTSNPPASPQFFL